MCLLFCFVLFWILCCVVCEKKKKKIVDNKKKKSVPQGIVGMFTVLGVCITVSAVTK